MNDFTFPKKKNLHGIKQAQKALNDNESSSGFI